MRTRMPSSRKIRAKRLLAGIVVASMGIAGAALASHVSEVDPETVPPGVLVAHNRIDWVGVKALERAVKPDGAEIYVGHIVLGPGEALPWHNHPGPAFAAIASGSVTLEKAKSGNCVRQVYSAGTGFFDRGVLIHRVVAGDDGAHIYATYVMPAGAEMHATAHDAPPECV